MEETDKKERAKLTEEMMGSKWFKKYFKPEIESIIEQSENIKKIDEKNLEKSFYQQKIKCDIYRGILNRLDNWVKTIKLKK